MHDFEKLGSFYLGREYDLAAGSLRPDLVLYDAKDLTTHAVCVGMTGSGKTGLCLTLLEEAAIDGIPAIAIDPKGDLGNLLLTFPELRPQDFQPWIDPGEAARRGLSPEQFAAETAQRWQEGLAEWGQDGSRIRRFREAADLAIYTPGSSAGLPLAVLRSFAVPPPAVLADADALRGHVTATVSGLLALLGIEADPVQSREHILLANLLESAWRGGRGLDIAEWIRQIQSPPLAKIGFLDLETFYPAKDRLELALRLNSLAASPAFAGWIEGEPLDIGRLLYTAEGRPRLSILSLAHLSDAERMFFVTILLNEVLSWIRSQPGTSSLRAILYMDEVFGYFPPTANPPSKTPMLTLLKQARAYGLGIVLATQNPVDLDYKGLSNAGTWLLGRLQTERDKARVLEGLEGASAGAAAAFDRGKMESLLAGLGSRVFLMNNVHEDQPVVFQTRWALSYLRGPLTRSQIQTLMEPRKPSADAATVAETPAPKAALPERAATESGPRPVVPPEASEQFLTPSGPIPRQRPLLYEPMLLGTAKIHFVDKKTGVDLWQTVVLQAQADEDMAEPDWEAADRLDEQPAAAAEPAEGASFAPLPSPLARAKSYAAWQKTLRDHLYRSERLVLWKSAALKLTSEPGESEAEFHIRLRQVARESRDLEVEKLRTRYASKADALQRRKQQAEERVAREQSQFTHRSLETAISFGSSLLGAFLGRKVASRTNVTRAASTMRSLGRAARERSDIGRAEDSVEAIQVQIDELDAEFQAEVGRMDQRIAGLEQEIEEVLVPPRKSDIGEVRVVLAWVPSR